MKDKTSEMKPTDKDNIIYKKHLVIAGPCSAENEEQVMQTAIELAALKRIDLLRAGVWKPRTNPGGFEGAGTKGLSWLLKAKQVTGLPTTVEVATSKHVEDAMSFDTDVLWIGARTTVNPFSVQQIADALKGTTQTILIKNPVNPDIKLWIGAVERIRKAGIENVGLIHRGFSSYGNTEFRNVPMWQIPIEMKRLFPELPLIVDSSHICGNRTGLLSVAQKGADLDYDGVMIETHYKPDTALTDKQQQITPLELYDLLRQLVWKSVSTDKQDFINQLDRLREQINYIDEELLSLISNRMNMAKQIGEIKKNNDITVLQTSRWNEILERALKKAEKIGLSDDFIRSYMDAIHIESIRIQNSLNGSDTGAK